MNTDNTIIAKLLKKVLELQDNLFHYKLRFNYNKWKADLFENYIRRDNKQDGLNFYEWCEKVKGFDYFKKCDKLRKTDLLCEPSNWLDGEKETVREDYYVKFD